MVRGRWRPIRIAIYWPPLLWPSALCLSRSPGLLNRRLRGPLCWLSLLHLISNFSGLQLNWGSWGPLQPGVAFPITSRLLLQLIRGPKGPFGQMWLSLPHLVYNSVSNCLTSVLTDLYNSSTPTQSLEWHVWSSSSGNNCHAVQRSLSSSVSVYECIMGFFTLSHFVSQSLPMRFPLITAIGMCHFLPVHHLGMASLAGSKVKIQHWEQWQWRSALHSPKSQHHWNLTIRLFSVISRTLIGGGVLPLCRGSVSVFYSPSQLGKALKMNWRQG